MDAPNVAPAGPAAPDSQIYIALQVRHSRGNQAASFYEDVFGAIPIHREVQEVGLQRPTYGRLNRIIYLRYNANIIFKVVEVDMPANLTSLTHVVPNIYVDDPAEIVQRAQQYEKVKVTTECDGDIQLTILKDPYAHVWTIGSSALAPGLY